MAVPFFLFARLSYKALYGIPVALDIADRFIAFSCTILLHFFVAPIFTTPFLCYKELWLYYILCFRDCQHIFTNIFLYFKDI